jgi:hypothetical protein
MIDDPRTATKILAARTSPRRVQESWCRAEQNFARFKKWRASLRRVPLKTRAAPQK